MWITRVAGPGRLWQCCSVPPTPPDQLAVPRLHRAARFEDAVHGLVERRLRRTGWQPNIIAYAGYGAPGWARVLCRVLLGRPDTRRRGRLDKVRGWRSFATLPAKHVAVTIEADGVRQEVTADRSGFVDTVIEADFTPGWGCVRLSVADAEPVEALVRVLDPAVRFGILSDIDDTVMVTALPRPLLAAWNTFVLDEHARTAVPGMAVLYERLATAHPGAPVFYLSTGAWNVAPTLTRFLSRHLYPAGPLLLTDWGPTARPLVPQRPGAQAGHAGPAGQGVPRDAVAADRRRRAARPGDLPGVRRRAPGPRRSGGDPAAVADAVGARRQPPGTARTFLVGPDRPEVAQRPRRRRPLEAPPRSRPGLTSPGGLPDLRVDHEVDGLVDLQKCRQPHDRPGGRVNGG